MGLHSTCTEQFPGLWSRIKRRISLDYSLWWPLRVLSSGYLKHSPPSTLRPAQRKLQGFGPFERFKVQAFRALITHSAFAMESWPSPRCIFSHDDGSKDGILHWGICFSWWLTLISLYTHFLPRTVRWFTIKLPGSCCPLSNIYLRLMRCQIAEFLHDMWEISGGRHAVCAVFLGCLFFIFYFLFFSFLCKHCNILLHASYSRSRQNRRVHSALGSTSADNIIVNEHIN